MFLPIKKSKKKFGVEKKFGPPGVEKNFFSRTIFRDRDIFENISAPNFIKIRPAVQKLCLTEYSALQMTSSQMAGSAAEKKI